MSEPSNSIYRDIVPKTKLLSFFAQLKNWVVLRNGDLIGNLERGGDCDILVADKNEAELLLIRVLGVPLYIARRSYVTGYYYDWGYIDLFEDYQWRGVRFFDSNFALSNSTINKHGFPVLSEAIESCVMLLTSLLWGGFVKSRYVKYIYKSFWRDKNTYLKYLQLFTGPKASSLLYNLLDSGQIEQSVNHLKQIRFYVLAYHLSIHPKRCWVGYVNFVRCEVLIRIINPIAPVVALKTDITSSLSAVPSATVPRNHALFPNVRIFDLSDFGFGIKLRIFLSILRSLSFLARSGFIVFLTSDRKHTKVRRILFWQIQSVQNSAVYQHFCKY